MSKFSRDKGKRGEYEMVDFFTKVSGVKYRRTPLSGGIHDITAMDLMKVDKKPSIFDNVYIEVKNHATLKVPQWIKQCDVGAEDMQMFNPKWVICMKHNHKWYYLLNETYFEHLNEIKKKYEEERTD